MRLGGAWTTGAFRARVVLTRRYRLDGSRLAPASGWYKSATGRPPANYGPKTIGKAPRKSSPAALLARMRAMFYLVQGHDADGSLPLRRAQRPAHLARVQALRDAGRLLLAGPLPAIDAADPGEAGFVGSVIVAEFDSLAAARAWADADPYLIAGAWQRVDVHPFVRVF